MAPDLTHPLYKKRLASNRRGLDSVSPVDSLAPSHAKPAPQPTLADSSKKGKPSRSKPRKALARFHSSTTTPRHVASAIMSDIDDKKRNKLGYQRISIACSHCRRRKIRCLVAEGDPQNRCQNCIRLKKECLFFPVDQQGAIDSRPDGKSNPNHGSAHTPSVTTSPSQDSISGHIEHGAYPVYPDMRSDCPNIPITPGGMLVRSAPGREMANLNPGQYMPNEYPMQAPGPPTSWSPATEYPPQGQAISSASSYLGYSNPVLTPDYSHFPGVPDSDHPVPRVASIGGYGSEGDRWSSHHPARSFSYPDYASEGLYSSRYPPDLQHPNSAFTQPPLQMPVHSAPMHGYGQPLGYPLMPDQSSGSISGVQLHSTMSASWAPSGGLSSSRDEKSRTLVGPQ